MVYDITPLIDVLRMLAGMEKNKTFIATPQFAVYFIWLSFSYSSCDWDSNIFPALLWQCSIHTELITRRNFWSMSHYQIFIRQQNLKTLIKTPNSSGPWLPSKAAQLSRSQQCFQNYVPILIRVVYSTELSRHSFFWVNIGVYSANSYSSFGRKKKRLVCSFSQD